MDGWMDGWLEHGLVSTKIPHPTQEKTHKEKTNESRLCLQAQLPNPLPPKPLLPSVKSAQAGSNKQKHNFHVKLIRSKSKLFKVTYDLKTKSANQLPLDFRF